MSIWLPHSYSGAPMTIRILLVDDSPNLLMAVRQFLATLPGTEVCGEAHDGQEGLTLVEQLKPDLVLLDISMPIMNGLDMARALQAFPQAPQVVFLSLQEGAAYVAVAQKLGALALIRKSDLVEGLPPIIQKLQADRQAEIALASAASSSHDDVLRP